MNEIGKKLRELRGKMTQKEVSEAIGITPTALSNYEQGIRIPRDDVKKRIAHFYGKSVGEIFFAN